MNIKKITNNILQFTIHRLIEIIGVSVSLVGFLLLLALISYSPADPNFIFSEIPLGSPSYKRISMNLACFLNTKRCILLVTNSDKRLVVEKASTNNKMPLYFLINQDKTKLEFSDIDF